MKDEYDNVIPTNTINIEVPKSLFDTHDNRKYVLKPGCYIVYENGIGHVYKERFINYKLLEMIQIILFILLPFMLVVKQIHYMYHITSNELSCLSSFIILIKNSPVQFISTSLHGQENS